MATDRPMQLGMVGLGRMGANLVQRLARDGHRCVVYDVNVAAVEKLTNDSVVGASSLEDDVVARLDPIFRTIAPGEDGTATTPWRTRTDGTAQLGYLHCGPNGAGHFVKMVHNGIEYGMMASIAEGLSILKHAKIGTTNVEADAETTPLRSPEFYQFDFDLAEVAEVWRHGSVVGSWLIDLTADALSRSPELSEYSGRVSASGEGRWTIEAAIDESVPTPVISAALWQRFESRNQGEFTAKVLSAMRAEFGGHVEKSS